MDPTQAVAAPANTPQPTAVEKERHDPRSLQEASGQPSVAQPKPKRPRFTVLQVHNLLTKHHGNRKAVADEMGITLESLKGRIYAHEFLRLQWCKESMLEKAKEQLSHDTTPENVIEKMIADQTQQLDLNAGRILQQLKKLEARIDRDEEARKLPRKTSYSDYTPEEQTVLQHLFRCNDRGEPTEENMVREQYGKLLEEYRRVAEVCQKAALTKARVLVLLGKYGPQGNKPRPRIGMKPKSESIVNVIAQQVQVKT